MIERSERNVIYVHEYSISQNKSCPDPQNQNGLLSKGSPCFVRGHKLWLLFQYRTEYSSQQLDLTVRSTHSVGSCISMEAVTPVSEGAKSIPTQSGADAPVLGASLKGADL